MSTSVKKMFTISLLVNIGLQELYYYCKSMVTEVIGGSFMYVLCL